MTFRNRIFITVVLLCHLFLMPVLVISQLQPEDAENPPAQAGANFPADVQDNGDQATIKAREQEKQGNVYTLRGDAEIDYRNYVLRADRMTYDADSGTVTLSGNVVLDGGGHDEHITATHGTYNIHTESGKFYDVVGSTGAKLRGRTIVLTTSTPFSFTGAEVEKVGRDKFIVRNGRVTSCTLPKPKWVFDAHEVEVVAGENAKIYHSTFRLFGLPVFYFPYVQHPVERLARQSGFLLPHIGNSTEKGFTIGEAFYWAMSRSADATIGTEYFSRRGWAQNGAFRWKPSDNAFVNLTYFGVLDRGSPITQTIFVPGVGESTVNNNPGGEEVRLNGETKLPLKFRAVTNIDYLSQFLFRAVYAERFSEAINTEVKSVAFLSRTEDGYSINGMTSRYQNFQSTQPGDVITIVHAPSGEFSSVDRKLGHSPFYWSFNNATEGLSRREPGFVTNNVVGRFDVQPNISLPLVWKGWSFRPELSLRDTYYTQRRLPGPANSIGTPIDEAINRRALDTSFEVRPPALAKVFDRTFLNHKIKHSFEPRFNYRLVSGVNNFQEIVRFDYRDILANTNEIEYGFVNRFFSKRLPKPGCETASDIEADDDKKTDATAAQTDCATPQSREFLSWEIAQKYFFDPNFGGALIPNRPNVFTTTVDFTGIAFLTEPRRFSPIISRLRVNTGSRSDLDWQFDYDTVNGRISSSMELATFKVAREIGFSAGHAFLQAPGEAVVSNSLLAPSKFNQFRMQLNYGSLSRRGLNAAALVGYDVNLKFLQYAAVQTTYNWDCCGLTFEYRRYNLGTVRDESQYRFALTLANIGTFGTMRKQERLF